MAGWWYTPQTGGTNTTESILKAEPDPANRISSTATIVLDLHLASRLLSLYQKPSERRASPRMSDYAHKPKGGLKFKGEGEKCVTGFAAFRLACCANDADMQEEEEEVLDDYRTLQG